MAWGKFVVQSVTGMDFVGTPVPRRTLVASAPPVITRKSRKQKADEEPDVVPGEEATEVYISIPVLLNRVPLKSGDEVVAYRPKPAKRTRDPEAITISKVARMAVKASSSTPGVSSSSDRR
jgi:hypothetical protein